jgi:hypothetical protein
VPDGGKYVELHGVRLEALMSAFHPLRTFAKR